MEALDKLLDKCVDALTRDITCLLQESTKGLSSTRASSLTAYIKLLREIQEDEKESEEVLRQKIEEALRRVGPGAASNPK